MGSGPSLDATSRSHSCMTTGWMHGKRCPGSRPPRSISRGRVTGTVCWSRWAWQTTPLAEISCCDCL
eukprot:s148_g11.t1